MILTKCQKTAKNRYFHFFKNLFDELYIDLTDIKYTKSEKDDTFSYHVIIPKYSANLETQLYLVKQIKEDFGFNEIDLSVYENNRGFGLPNQSNKEKPIIHSIVNGQMSDFL